MNSAEIMFGLPTKVLLVFFILKNLVEGSENCGVVPMLQWAGSKTSRTDPLTSPINLVVIQHTVTSTCETDASCEALANSIRSYHKKIGFIDIGQSFLIGGNGKVYEGAGWYLVGAHTLKYNIKSIGISFIGDFRKSLPTSEALQAAKDLLSCGVEARHLTEDYCMVAHRQLSLTESPGLALYEHVKTWPHWTDDASKF